MKIAALTTSYPTSEYSVSGIFVKRLMEHMPADSSVFVLTPEDPESIIKSTGKVRVRTFRYAPTRWERVAHSPGGIPAALQQNKLLYLLIPPFLITMFISFFRLAKHSDVLHANWAICGCIAGLAGRLLGRPVITTVRGEDVSRSKTSIFHQLALTLAIRLSHRIVTVSNAFERWIIQNYPADAEKFQTIENGVDDIFIAAGKERSTSIPNKKTIHMLTIGSLIPRKGINQILQALASINKQSSYTLTVIGAGPEERNLRDITVELDLCEQTEFIGAVPPNEIPKWFSESDVFILASHSEGRPNVILEAMAAGLPVIATDIDGINELVMHGTTGLLFPDNDIDGLSAHITTLLENPKLREQYGRNGHELIIKRDLVWQKTAARYVELYRTLSSQQTRRNLF